MRILYMKGEGSCRRSNVGY